MGYYRLKLKNPNACTYHPEVPDVSPDYCNRTDTTKYFDCKQGVILG